ncbi:MAG: hypothetical protein LQ352_005227 [Teloschistes flavicans]|nr:MAG: hypothetical protein LQ352_005227 [Teloschistes flavicans]
MRLLKHNEDGSLNLTEDLLDQDNPKYVVLSHTWGPAKQEVTLQDLQSPIGEQQMGKAGYAKVRFCSNQAAHDGYEYSWIDTCCIDKTNNVELTEAINSMFRWYREAARCYVYLSDVKVGQSQNNDWHNDFVNSRWFTRGWTLQELLAPKSVEFFSSDGVRLGDKSSLEGEIYRATGIAIDALRGRSLSDFSVSERMAWATKRTTTRKEDEAYSLLGIFDVYMPLIYGERERALVRLMEQIDRSLQGPGQQSYSSVRTSDTSMPALHPVKKNYRKVHVTILYWAEDGLQDVVRRIADVFRSSYHYEVREIPLPHRQREKLAWPWVDDSIVDERDLQIMYYLGSTMANPTQNIADLRLAASPARRVPSRLQELYPRDPELFGAGDMTGHRISESCPGPGWLSTMIGIPQLDSDALVVLDCFVEGLDGPDCPDDIHFLLDDDNSWARYLLLFAGYETPSAVPGRLSQKLMSLLEDLATSRRFYAREGLITSQILRQKLEREIRFDDDLNLHWMRLDILWDGLVAVQFYCSLVAATALKPRADLQNHSLEAGGPPSEFKVRLTTDPHFPLNNRDIWMNVLDFTYEISSLGLLTVWNPGDWSLKDSGVAVSLKLPAGAKASQMTGQQILWGVNYIAFSMAISRRFCAMTGILTWDGKEFGRILIHPSQGISTTAILTLTTADNVTLSNDTVIQEMSASKNASSPANYLITEKVQYGNKIIAEDDIFQTAIRAIIDATELGLQKSVPALFSNGVRGCSWKLLRDDMRGHDALLADYSRQAVHRTVHKMNHDNKFRKIYVLVYVGDPLVAIGGFDSTASTLAASTE